MKSTKCKMRSKDTKENQDKLKISKGMNELDTPLTLSKISNNQPSSNYYTEGKILNIKCKI